MLEDFITKLEKVSKHGKHYMARCPAHKDGRPSLRVSMGDKGILLRCFAGCEFKEIANSLNMKYSDFFIGSLSQEQKDEYRFNALCKEVISMGFKLFFYEADMKLNKLHDKEMADYRRTIQELINCRHERDTLKKQYGFEEIKNL